MHKQLQELGLTNNEAKIYLALLELGSSIAGKISRKTGIHRRTIYDALERLTEKGLVSYIVKNNRKYFEASDPKQLLTLIEEKKESINTILPKLEQTYNIKKQKQETLFFKGKQGLKSIFEDQLKERKEILIFGASPNAYQILKYYFKWYDKDRVKKKIKVKIIFDSTARNKIKNIPNAEIKFLPRNYATPAATNIYGNKVAIINWSGNPLAILINQKEIAQSYKNYFNILWKVAKK